MRSADASTRPTAIWLGQPCDCGGTVWNDPRSTLEAHLAEARAETARLREENETLRSLDDLRRRSNAHVMDGFKRIAVIIEDSEPVDLGYVDMLVMLVRHIVERRQAAESSLSALREQIRGLVEQWERETTQLMADRDEFTPKTAEYFMGAVAVDMVRACRIELAALLAEPERTTHQDER